MWLILSIMFISKGFGSMFTLKVDHETDLRLLQLPDSTKLYRLIDSNREHFREWLPWVDDIVSSLQLHSVISAWLTQYYERNGFQTGIWYRQQLIGVIGLHSIDWQNKQTSIGYYLAEGFEGKGIVTRSVQTLLHYIFTQLHLHRVEIRCGKDNIKSRAIPERLGFKKEGLIRDGEFVTNHFHDLVVYGMLEHEWMKTIDRIY